MLKKLLFLFFTLASIALLNACKRADINFSSQLLDNTLTQIIMTDTFNTELSTVYIDSFSTGSTGVTVFGGYTDPYFGRLDAQTFYEIAPPTTTATDYVKSIYDSLYITLKLRNTFYGDTTKPIHIQVSRLAEPIIPPSFYGDPGSVLYSKNSFAVYPTPLGSINTYIRPSVDDSIHIKLNDAMGQELFNKIKTASLDLQSTSNFLSYFYGLRIASNSNSNAVYTCADSATVYLAYHNPNLNKDSARLAFPLVNRNLHFIHVNADRMGTALQNLGGLNQPGKVNAIKSTQTGNMAFSQPISNTMIKVRFPNIQDVQKLPYYAKFLKAQLIVRPVANSFSPLYYLPPQLRLSTTTILNMLGQDLTAVAAPGAGAGVQYGSLVTDYFSGKSYYTYDLTNYVKSILADPEYPYFQSGLLLTPPNPAFQSQFARLVAGNRFYPNINCQIELDLYYASVKSY
ncbi:DUF4270 family protein [Hydrotalea sp.]|uniref:DUF4270 family protein n=1 Tax=Hydrotalea sp. TaxID=2881279 RepID=UPI002601AA30|nr:DUF4270 family protein [Hydrotalea sp.]